MVRVFTGGRTWLDPLVVPIERLVLRLSGVDGAEQQDWKAYGRSLVVSNIWMWLAGFAVISVQAWLPLNPDGIGTMEPTLAFHTVSSFRTNTNLHAIHGSD